MAATHAARLSHLQHRRLPLLPRHCPIRSIGSTAAVLLVDLAHEGAACYDLRPQVLAAAIARLI